MMALKCCGLFRIERASLLFFSDSYFFVELSRSINDAGCETLLDRRMSSWADEFVPRLRIRVEIGEASHLAMRECPHDHRREE
jgi:hypothetical protein